LSTVLKFPGTRPRPAQITAVGAALRHPVLNDQSNEIETNTGTATCQISTNYRQKLNRFRHLPAEVKNSFIEWPYADDALEIRPSLRDTGSTECKMNRKPELEQNVAALFSFQVDLDSED
jgi:hypothetical protein